MKNTFLENGFHLNVNVNTLFSPLFNVATALITTVHFPPHDSETAVLVHRFKTKRILELEGLLDNL